MSVDERPRTVEAPRRANIIHGQKMTRHARNTPTNVVEEGQAS
jgi:hypothetical protein